VADLPVVPGTVYAESFLGLDVACNPLALQLALQQRDPNSTFTWGVQHRAITSPRGTTAVIRRSAAWWRARATAEIVLVNDWLNPGFVRKPGQTVLQTWHGTPYKKLSLDRPGQEAPKYRRKVANETAAWQYVLAESDYMAERLQSAYAYPGETWTLGYPRTDLLVTDDGSRREAVRSNLGAKPDQTVVLYAPTFRDKRTAFLSELDPSTLAEDLGPDYSLLVRRHRMVTTGTGIDTDRFLDVTMYRDITELMLAADVLVTDYSSVMFDFTASGKPVVFFVPDLDEYRDETRGVYFDLAAVAPGPLVETPHELAAALRGLEHDRAEYAGRYAAWQARFNGLDDGHAADRVLDRLDAAVAAARSETTAW
jgi:Putative glycosyl/glycerophosphate transferases involved in teichoic acid biosynthesis TagF/TagB/EpsJ/RodC